MKHIKVKSLTSYAHRTNIPCEFQEPKLVLKPHNFILTFSVHVFHFKPEAFSVRNLTSSDQRCLSFGIDNSFVHCSFQPSYRTSDGWVTRPTKESPPLFSFVLCSGVKQPLRVWETGCLSRQVKDRSGKSDREWEGLAEEENLMGESECSGGRVVVSLTYLLCATHETFSCSSRFFPRHLASPPFSRLSPSFLHLWLSADCFPSAETSLLNVSWVFFFLSFLKKRALSIWSTHSLNIRMGSHGSQYDKNFLAQTWCSCGNTLKFSGMPSTEESIQVRVEMQVRTEKEWQRDSRLGRESDWWL